MSEESLNRLLKSDVRIVNIGLIGFADDLEKSGASVVHVDWSPPRTTTPQIANLLAKLGA